MMKAENRKCAGYPFKANNGKEAPSYTFPLRTEGNCADSLLASTFNLDNLWEACNHVKRKRGAPGIDGVPAYVLSFYLRENGDELIATILAGKYKPRPVRREYIPKPDGGMRLLNIPTVKDRMIQRAMYQAMEPIFEPKFSDYSYGFRPGRSAHQAIRMVLQYYREGYRYAVKIDIVKCFDTVNQDLLLNMLRAEIKDKRFISLIRECLRSGIMQDGITSRNTEGTPQGGNLSPLLSNIYLTKFDRFLEKGGHKFVRYADDCNIYVRSRRAAERVMKSCTRFLEKELKLKINTEKSVVGNPLETKFLGFSLCQINGKVGVRVHDKTIIRFKARVESILGESGVLSTGRESIEFINYIGGWLGYFAIAEMDEGMEELFEWTKDRIGTRINTCSSVLHDNNTLGNSTAESRSRAKSKLDFAEIYKKLHRRLSRRYMPK